MEGKEPTDKDNRQIVPEVAVKLTEGLVSQHKYLVWKGLSDSDVQMFLFLFLFLTPFYSSKYVIVVESVHHLHNNRIVQNLSQSYWVYFYKIFFLSMEDKQKVTGGIHCFNR